MIKPNSLQLESLFLFSPFVDIFDSETNCYEEVSIDNPVRNHDPKIRVIESRFQ